MSYFVISLGFSSIISRHGYLRLLNDIKASGSVVHCFYFNVNGFLIDTTFFLVPRHILPFFIMSLKPANQTNARLSKEANGSCILSSQR